MNTVILHGKLFKLDEFVRKHSDIIRAVIKEVDEQLKIYAEKHARMQTDYNLVLQPKHPIDLPFCQKIGVSEYKDKLQSKLKKDLHFHYHDVYVGKYYNRSFSQPLKLVETPKDIPTGDFYHFMIPSNNNIKFKDKKPFGLFFGYKYNEKRFLSLVKNNTSKVDLEEVNKITDDIKKNGFEVRQIKLQYYVGNFLIPLGNDSFISSDGMRTSNGTKLNQLKTYLNQAEPPIAYLFSN
jgi:hypothetical protein